MVGGLSREGRVGEFEFWVDLGVDFMMLSVAYDFFLDDDKVARVIGLKDEFGQDLLIHPRPDGRTLQSPANPDAHELLFASLRRIEELVQRHQLVDKVVLHLSTYRIPTGNYATFSEEEAVANSRAFYEALKDFTGLTFVLENVYPPGIGWEELGYKTEHFGLFDLPEGCEFCLDTGHLNLSALNVEDILGLPFEVTCLHLHSNDGASDQHAPLTRRNFKEWREIESLLSGDKYIVVEVKSGWDALPPVLEHLRRHEIAP